MPSFQEGNLDVPHETSSTTTNTSLPQSRTAHHASHTTGTANDTIAANSSGKKRKVAPCCDLLQQTQLQKQEQAKHDEDPSGSDDDENQKMNEKNINGENGGGGPPPNHDEGAAVKNPHNADNNKEKDASTVCANCMQKPKQDQEEAAACTSRRPVTYESCDASSMIQAKAIDFVERICNIETDDAVSDAATAGCGGDGEIMSLVSSENDLVHFAERMFALQEEFRLQGRPTLVDIGYHYTEPENMPQIRTHGLLTQADRTALGVTTMKTHGLTYGDGVYTASNPVAFHDRYGAVGILVARLKGQPSTTVKNNGSNDPNLNAATNDEQPHTFNCYDSSPTKPHKMKRIVALRSSAQCLALYSFPASAISTTLEQDQAGNDHVYKYHCMIQAVVDEFFNNGVATEIESQKLLPVVAQPDSDQGRERIKQMQERLLLLHHSAKCKFAAGTCTVTPHCDSTKQLWEHMKRCSNNKCTVQHCFSSRAVLSHYRKCLDSGCPVCSPVRRKCRKPMATPGLQSKTLVYSAPEVHQPVDLESMLESVPAEALQESESNDCAICLHVMDGIGSVTNFDATIMKLKGCGHTFHASCIQVALARNLSCPMCRKPLQQRPQGPMPSGTMTISYKPHVDCAGYNSSNNNVGGNDKGSIVIRYELEGGIQKVYHPNPGVAFDGASRVAYLPNNEQGRKLLKRLEYAFECGLSFTVGRSMTTGRNNVITWSSIHHKSSPDSGAHGFPDPNYFVNCNAELDALHVPSADVLGA